MILSKSNPRTSWCHHISVYSRCCILLVYFLYQTCLLELDLCFSTLNPDMCRISKLLTHVHNQSKPIAPPGSTPTRFSLVVLLVLEKTPIFFNVTVVSSFFKCKYYAIFCPSGRMFCTLADYFVK